MGETCMKQCVLYDRECIDCGECDRCDLDPNKICDICMKCVMGDDEYLSLPIDEVQSMDDPTYHQEDAELPADPS